MRGVAVPGEELLRLGEQRLVVWPEGLLAAQQPTQVLAGAVQKLLEEVQLTFVA